MISAAYVVSFTGACGVAEYQMSIINVWVHVVNGRVFARSNKYTF